MARWPAARRKTPPAPRPPRTSLSSRAGTSRRVRSFSAPEQACRSAKEHEMSNFRKIAAVGLAFGLVAGAAGAQPYYDRGYDRDSYDRRYDGDRGRGAYGGQLTSSYVDSLE